MKTKWFYPAQATAKEKLDKMFVQYRCDWQVVTKDRVIEQYTGFLEEGYTKKSIHWGSEQDLQKSIQVICHMIKQGKDRFTVLIFKTQLIASN